MKYYIGVDGGGTKTALVLFDENKNVLATAEGTGSNHETLQGSFEEAANVIMDGIKELCEKQGITIDDIDAVLMGLAGIDHEFQLEAISDEFDDLGLKNYSIYNDGFIVIKAGVGKGAGIGYNCGTGTCCNSIDSNGDMLQIGGFSELSGDVGNGHYIAIEAFRIAYDDICLKKRKSLVTEYFAKETGVKDRDTLLASIIKIQGLESEKYIRLLIDAFFYAANNGDEAALEVIEIMAQRGADFISGHINNMVFNEDTVNVVLSGSIHTKLPSDIYIDRMKEILASSGKHKFNFTKLSVKPVMGCINWILEKEEESLK